MNHIFYYSRIVRSVSMCLIANLNSILFLKSLRYTGSLRIENPGASTEIKMAPLAPRLFRDNRRVIVGLGSYTIHPSFLCDDNWLRGR